MNHVISLRDLNNLTKPWTIQYDEIILQIPSFALDRLVEFFQQNGVRPPWSVE